MRKILLNPWIVGIVAVCVCRFMFGSIFDLEPVCHDGWRSPSIGRSGACSHHGGVDRSAIATANLLSVVIGIIIGIIINVLESSSPDSQKKTAHEQKEPNAHKERQGFLVEKESGAEISEASKKDNRTATEIQTRNAEAARRSKIHLMEQLAKIPEMSGTV